MCRNGARPERPGKRAGHARQLEAGPVAAMEPGLRDRENPDGTVSVRELFRAAMEPGLRDRENTEDYGIGVINAVAAMEPGLRDRENSSSVPRSWCSRWPQWSPA